MARPSARLEAAHLATMEFMAELDIEFALPNPPAPDFQSLLMRRLEAILTLVAPPADEPPTRTRSKANGTPHTGHEVPLFFWGTPGA